MISIKKYLTKGILISLLILIWYLLRWYFVIPRLEVLGNFRVSNTSEIIIYNHVNYDTDFYFYEYNLVNNGIKADRNITFYINENELRYNDLKLIEKENRKYIITHYDEINRTDTLLIIDNNGNIIFNFYKNFNS